MQIIVCEDDSLYQKSLQEKIARWVEESQRDNITVSFFSSSEEFLTKWEKGLRADILFLDILFENELDGMEVARQIRLTDTCVPIVFVTNSEMFIKEGYAVRAFRYLSKPLCYDDIAFCLDMAYKQYTLAHNEYFIIADGSRRIAIRYEEILYLEAFSPYTLVWMQSNKEPLKLRFRFLDLQNKLPGELFIPCHRSYIVNIMHVRRVKRHELFLSTSKTLPVSRAYMNRVGVAFDSYYQEGGAFIHVDRI